MSSLPSAIALPFVWTLEKITDPFIKREWGGEVKRVCVILLQGIGNAVLFTPALIELKKQFPLAEITILAKRENIEILSGFGGVEFLEYPTKEPLMGKLRFLKAARKKMFDVVVYGCPNVYIGSSLFSFALGGYRLLHRYRVGSYNHCGFLNSIDIGYRNDLSDVTQNLNLLSFIGVKAPENPVPSLPIPKNTGQKIREELKKAKGMKICLHIGAGGKIKKWPILYFVSLAEKLDKFYDCSIVLIGGPSEKEDIVQFLGKVKVKILNMTGKPLMETAAIIKSCDLMVSADSGPMHIATAVKTRTIAIYGPSTRFHRTLPVGDAKIVTLDVSCAPCTYWHTETCPIGTHHCLLALTPGRVFAEIQGYIGKSNKK